MSHAVATGRPFTASSLAGHGTPTDLGIGCSAACSGSSATACCAPCSTTPLLPRKASMSSVSAATWTPFALPRRTGPSCSAIAGSCSPCLYACPFRRAHGPCLCSSDCTATSRVVRSKARPTRRRPSWRARCWTCLSVGPDNDASRLPPIARTATAPSATACPTGGAVRRHAAGRRAYRGTAARPAGPHRATAQTRQDIAQTRKARR